MSTITTTTTPALFFHDANTGRAGHSSMPDDVWSNIIENLPLRDLSQFIRVNTYLYGLWHIDIEKKPYWKYIVQHECPNIEYAEHINQTFYEMCYSYKMTGKNMRRCEYKETKIPLPHQREPTGIYYANKHLYVQCAGGFIQWYEMPEMKKGNILQCGPNLFKSTVKNGNRFPLLEYKGDLYSGAPSTLQMFDLESGNLEFGMGVPYDFFAFKAFEDHLFIMDNRNRASPIQIHCRHTGKLIGQWDFSAILSSKRRTFFHYHF